MKFKENSKIWDSYINNRILNENYDMYDDGMAEDSEVIMSFEPEAPVEVDNGPEEESIDIALYTDIKKLSEYSDRLLKMAKETHFEPWMAAQLSKASSYVSDVWHRLDAKVDFANTGIEQSNNIDL